MRCFIIRVCSQDYDLVLNLFFIKQELIVKIYFKFLFLLFNNY